MSRSHFSLLSRRTLLAASAPTLAATRVRAQTAPAAPVRIAVLADMSGPYADNTGPGLVHAARMAVEDFGGRVLGRPIRFDFADDQNRPDVGVGIARRWLDDEGVHAIVAASASSITLAVAELTRARGRILLIAASGSTDLTGRACSPTSFQFGFDTYSLPKAVVEPAVRGGLRSWYILNVDYAFGHNLWRDATALIEQAGGRVIGSTGFPLNTADFASYLLQAQASRAQAVALATGGTDWTNLVKQAHEFGLSRGRQTLVSLATGFNEVQAAGLNVASGMLLATPFYWDRTEATRRFARRFMQRHRGVAPNSHQAAGYTGTLHYLKAVQAAGTIEGPVVAEAMRGMRVSDFDVEDAPIRADGQVMRPMHLARVRSPDTSRDRNDIFEILETIPGENAWRPAAESACPLLRPA
jgi:branched-chain amino acid transport system substrate-binding protein